MENVRPWRKTRLIHITQDFKKMKNRVLFLSGGGTKIPFMASAAIHLITDKEFKFKYFVGISSGAITALLLAMGKYDALRNTDIAKVFESPTSSILRVLTAIRSALSGKTILINENALRTRLKSLITEGAFNQWKNDQSSPDCHVMFTNINTSSIKMSSLKNMSYLEAVEIIISVSSVPITAGMSRWLRLNYKKVQECYVIHSRSNDQLVTKRIYGRKIWRWYYMINRIIEIMDIELSDSDYKRFADICHEQVKRCENIFPKSNDGVDQWTSGIDAIESNHRLCKKI